MKSKIAFVLLLLVMVFVISIPTAYAYMIKQTGTVKNVIKPAQLSAQVHENFDGTKKTSVKVQNTSNIEVYIRMRVITNWEDSKGNKVAISSTMPAFNVSSDWIAGDGNTYYYKKPVAAGVLTTEFLANNSTITLEGKTVLVNGVNYTYHQVVEFITEVIQSKPDSVVTEVWPVTVDGNGNITSVKTN